MDKTKNKPTLGKDLNRSKQRRTWNETNKPGIKSGINYDNNQIETRFDITVYKVFSLDNVSLDAFSTNNKACSEVKTTNTGLKCNHVKVKSIHNKVPQTFHQGQSQLIDPLYSQSKCRANHSVF